MSRQIFERKGHVGKSNKINDRISVTFMYGLADTDELPVHSDLTEDGFQMSSQAILNFYPKH